MLPPPDCQRQAWPQETGPAEVVGTQRGCHPADRGAEPLPGHAAAGERTQPGTACSGSVPPCALSPRPFSAQHVFPLIHSPFTRSLVNPLKPSMRSLSADLWTATRGQDLSGHKLSIQLVCSVWGVSKERHYRGSN